MSKLERIAEAVFHGIALLFFIAITSVILIGAYASSQADMWLVAALAVMILWHVYEYVCDNSRRK
jgi:hypothetical protein